MENQLRKLIRLELGYGLKNRVEDGEKYLVRDLGTYEIEISGSYNVGIGMYVWKKDGKERHIAESKSVTISNIKQVYNEYLQKYESA